MLFEPIWIRRLELKNRIVMAPMTTRLAGPDGPVTPELMGY
jgi:2,4-dienoyl-CoA reductase (NADPH2)